jgi:hypothetical protein
VFDIVLSSFNCYWLSRSGLVGCAATGLRAAQIAKHGVSSWNEGVFWHAALFFSGQQKKMLPGGEQNLRGD